MVTFDELRAADAGRYDRAADAWRAAARTIRDRADDLLVARNRLGGAWDDDAGDAAWAQLSLLVDRLDSINEAWMRLDQVLSGHAAGVRQAQSLLHEGLQLAAGYGVAVGADGSVEIPRQGGQVQASMITITDRISALVDEAVRQADDLDVQTAADLAFDIPLLAQKATVVDLSTVPAAGTDPAAVKRWWDGLSEEQRRWLIEHDPDAVGRLDGVPAAARDEANRIVLHRLEHDLQAQQDALKAHLDDPLNDPANIDPDTGQPTAAAYVQQGQMQAQIDALQTRLNALQAIDTRISTIGPTGDRGYLLLIDNQGNGHAIVATGNPDTAANLVTYVPGTGSNLDGIGGGIHRADLMADKANQFNPTAHTVGMVWLGYDAPQTVPQAMDISYANHATADLSRFQAGLGVTHVGVNQDFTPAHTTVIGHSYGSTVVGVAQRDAGLHANDLIFVGSPGVGVDNAAGLHMDGSHVWSSHLTNDPILGAKNIHHTGKDVALNVVLPGAGTIDFATNDQLLYGTNPDSPDFGGHHFASQDGTPGYQDFGKAHSEYWDPYSASLNNIGHIVAGQPAQVTP